MAELDELRALAVTEWRKGHGEMAITSHTQLAERRDGLANLRKVLGKLLGFASQDYGQNSSWKCPD